MEVGRLHQELGAQQGIYETFSDIARLTALAERVADAPEASSDAFIASVWDHGVEQASDLVDAVATLELIRTTWGTELHEIAWDTDVKQPDKYWRHKPGYYAFEWEMAWGTGARAFNYTKS